MPSITTFLTFNTQAEDAAKFYTSIFPNSKITKVSHFPDIPWAPFKAGSVMTVEFTLEGREFIALNGGPSFTPSQAFSICVQSDTQAEVDCYWHRLLEGGGKPSACGWLTDKFGVSWQIDPKILMQLVTDPNPEKAKKAMSAM